MAVQEKLLCRHFETNRSRALFYTQLQKEHEDAASTRDTVASFVTPLVSPCKAMTEEIHRATLVLQYSCIILNLKSIHPIANSVWHEQNCDLEEICENNFF